MQNLIDSRSLKFIMGLTQHNRATRSLLHLHTKKKPPSISAQFQVQYYYYYRSVQSISSFIIGLRIGLFHLCVKASFVVVVNEIKGSNPLSCGEVFDMICRGLMDADGQINESHDFISNTVQASLSKLLETLRKAEPFFVRCIRSNGDKVWWRAVVSFVMKLLCVLGDESLLFYVCWRTCLQREMLFDDALVLQQLRYTGMLQTVRIRRSGYGAKFTFKVM